MRTIGHVLIAAAVLTLGFGVVQASAAKKGKHAHGIALTQRVSSGTVAAGAVQSLSASCPGGTKLTGGGHVADGPVLTPTSGPDGPGTYTTVFDARFNAVVRVQVKAVCVSTKAR